MNIKSMFDHIGIFVSKPEASFRFFESCLAPLGYIITKRHPQWGSIVFTRDETPPFLWVGPARGEYYGTSVDPSVHRPMHLAFTAPTKESVEEFHRRGLENGGRDNGVPAVERSGAYGAFLLDPDGNNIEAIFREQNR